MPPKVRRRYASGARILRGLNGNTSPSSSRDNHLVGFSESPDGSSSDVSLGSPIIPSSKLVKGSGLGNNGHEHGALFFFISRIFSLTFGLDRPNSENVSS
jgi:hypothetical protein